MIIVRNILFVSFTIILSFVVGELMVRLKNSTMKNYDIEMWKYSKELKVISENKLLGHEHVSSKCSTLESVEVCLNSNGFRGDELNKIIKDRRILFLGSSITLGWGVENSKVMTSLLQNKFNDDDLNVEVINAGIGNYNTVRYVERFLTKLKDTNPTDIVVHYFINDAEELPIGGGNIFLRNSQLAVTGWIAYQRIFNSFKKGGLSDYYESTYMLDSSGFTKMKESLEKLSKYAKTKGINIYLAMTPDIHFLKDYPFKNIHATMKNLSNDFGYKYVDLYPYLEGIEFEKLQIIPGDAHPNEYGHELMANALYEHIK